MWFQNRRIRRTSSWSCSSPRPISNETEKIASRSSKMSRLLATELSQGLISRYVIVYTRIRISKSTDPNKILSTQTFVCLLRTFCAHQELVLLLLIIHSRYLVSPLPFTSYGTESDTCLRSHACGCNGCWPSTSCL